MFFLIPVIFFIKIIYADESLIYNGVYVCRNTFTDSQLSDFLYSKANSLFNFQNSTYYIRDVYCDNNCEEMSLMLENIVLQDGIDFYPFIIGYWNNVTYLSCLSNTLRSLGLHLFNVCPLTSICEYNIYSSYHPQNLILSLINIVIDFPPLSLIYNNLSNLNHLLYISQNFFSGLLVKDNIHKINGSESDYALLRQNSNVKESNGIIYLLNEEIYGLNEFIDFVVSLERNVTVFLVGYFNRNYNYNIIKSLNKLNNYYIISPYFSFINNMENNEVKVTIQNEYPTFQTAMFFSYLLYIKLLNSQSSQFTLYNIDLTIKRGFHSPFGDICMDKDHFLVLPTYISNSSLKIIKKEIIPLQSSYLYLKNVSDMMKISNRMQMCNFKRYDPVYYKKIKYILIVSDCDDERVLFQLFFAVVYVENMKSYYSYIDENNMSVLFFRNVGNIPYPLYAEGFLACIISYLNYENRKKITILNHGAVYLFNVNTFEGSACSPLMINVGKSVNTLISHFISIIEQRVLNDDDYSIIGLKSKNNSISELMERNFGSILLRSGYKYNYNNNSMEYYNNFKDFNISKFNSSSILISFMSKEDNIHFINTFGPFAQYQWSFYILEWELKDSLDNPKSEGIYTLSEYYQYENGMFSDFSLNDINVEYVTTQFVMSKKIVTEFVEMDSEGNINRYKFKSNLFQDIYSNQYTKSHVVRVINNKFQLISNSISSRIISYYNVNEDKMTLCNWKTKSVDYDSVYLIGFLYDVCGKKYIDYIDYLNSLIWILNSEYDGIDNIPVIVHIISFVSSDCKDSRYLSPSHRERFIFHDLNKLLMIITPYYPNLIEYIKTNAKNVIVNLIDENSGDLCLSNLFVYGITPYQQIYPFFLSILFKIRYLVFYGNSDDDNHLSLIHKELISSYCVAYMMECLFFETNSSDSKNIINYIESNKDEINDKNLFIITSLPLFNSNNLTQFYTEINSYSQTRNYKIKIFDLLMDRIEYDNNNLLLLKYIDIHIIEPIPIAENELLLKSHFADNNNEKEIIPVVYNMWNALSDFKEAYEYTVSNDFSLLWTKIRSIISDYNHINNNNNFLADNYIYQKVRIIKRNVLDFHYEVVFKLNSPIFNKISSNFVFKMNRDYYSICEIDSQYESKISKKKGISVLFISTMNENNYNKSIYSRVSQIVSINEIEAVRNKYIIPIYYNAKNTSNIEINSIISLINSLKNDYDITIKHIFGIFSDSVYEENVLKNENDLLLWSPILHSGLDYSNSMIKCGFSFRQIIQEPLSYLMKYSNKIVIVYSNYEIEKVLIEMLEYYIKMFDKDNDEEILAKVTVNNEEYEELDEKLIELYYRYPTEKIIVLNLLQDPQSSKFFEHFVSHYLLEDFIDKFLILSFGSTPIFDSKLFIGQYDVIQMSIDEIVGEDEITYNLKEELMKVLPFYYANNIRIYWNTYISLKLFSELLNLPDINNVSAVAERLSGEYVYNDPIIGSVKMNEYFMMMRSYRIMRYVYNPSNLENNNGDIVLFINYTSSPIVIDFVDNNSEVVYVGIYNKNNDGDYDSSIVSSVVDAFSSISYFFNDVNITLIPVVFKKLNEIFNESNSNEYDWLVDSILNNTNSTTNTIFHVFGEESILCLKNVFYYSPTHYLVANVASAYLQSIVQKDVYLLYYETNEIYINTIVEIFYLYGLNVIGVSKIPMNEGYFKYTIQSIFFKLKSGGTFYCIGSKGMIDFVNYLIQSIQFDYQYSLYLQGLSLESITNDIIPSIKYKLNIYFHHVSPHLYYFDQIILIKTVNEVYVSQILFFILTVFINISDSIYNTNIFLNNFYNIYLNDNVEKYYHNIHVKMSRGHYLYQQLYLYQMYFNGKNQMKISTILKNTDSFLINDPNMYNNKPLCDFPAYNNRVIYNIALSYSITGTDRERDINMFLVAYRTLVYLNELFNIEINGVIHKIYYVVYDLKSDEKYCEEVLKKINGRKITYIFGFAHYCFDYLKHYPNIVVYYPKLLPEFKYDNYLPPNVISFGGKVNQLLYSFPFFTTNFHSHNFVIVYTNSTMMSKYIPSIEKYISVYSFDVQTISVEEDKIFMNGYIESILSKIDLSGIKVYSILIYMSFSQTKLFLNSYNQYSEKYKNHVQIYLINSGDKYLTVIKPKFKCYTISFYFSNVDTQANVIYSEIVNIITPENSSYGYSVASFDSIFSFVLVSRKIQSFEPSKIFKFYEENRGNTFPFLSGKENLNEYNYLSKHSYIGAYYPEKDEFKIEFDTRTILNYIPVKYDTDKQLVEVRYYTSDNKSMIVSYRKFFTLLYLCNEKGNSNCNNLYELLKSGIFLYNNDNNNNNKYYMFLVKVMSEENEESIQFIKKHLEKGYLTALFFSGNEDFLMEFAKNSIVDESNYLISSKFFIFFLPPELKASVEGITYKNIVYASGNVFTFLRHTITHVILESIKFNDEIAIFYYDSFFYNYCSDQIEKMFKLYYPLTIVHKYNVMYMINREYSEVRIQNVKVFLTVIPLYLERLLDSFSYYNISRSIPVIALYYQNDIIKKEPKVFYIRSYNRHIKKKWNKELNYIFNVSKLVANGVDLDFTMLDIWATLYRSFYLLKTYLNKTNSDNEINNDSNYFISLVDLDENYNFTVMNRENGNNNNNDNKVNYLNQDYYMCFYNDIYNENVIQSYGFDIPQDLYVDDTSMMCDWECDNIELIKLNSYISSIKVGILYNPYNTDLVQYSSFLLHTILYDILISDSVNGYKIKPYICSNPNYLTCNELLKYYESKNINFVFGGFFSECLTQMFEYFSHNKESNLLVFYTGEIDDYFCDRHIIQMGPTPSQIINLLLLTEYNADIPFSIVTSSKSQYPRKVAEYFRETFLRLGFEVEVIDIEKSNCGIFFSFENPIVVVTLNRDEQLELFHTFIKPSNSNNYSNENILLNSKFIYIACGEEMVSRFGYSNSEILLTFPPNSYFIDSFFHQLTLIPKGTSSFDININKDITKIYSTVLGGIYYIPSTSEIVYTSFEIWKEVTTKLDTFDVEEIRRSLYNYGYLGATGPITIFSNNFVSRRMFYGKYDNNLRIIEVISSPTSQILPHNIREKPFICECESKFECSVDDYKDKYYQIIIIYDESEIKSSIILSVVTLLTQINERNTEYMEFNNYDRIIISHIIIIRNGRIPENEYKEYILDERTIALLGCISLKCKEIVTPIADSNKIPFFYIGKYHPTHSPYTFYYGINIDSSIIALIKYLKTVGLNTLMVIEDREDIGIDDLEANFIPFTEIIDRLITFSNNYEFDITIDSYYYVDINETYSNLNYVISELEKIDGSMVIVNFLYGNNLNQFLKRFYTSKILTNIVTNIFMAFNSYDLDESLYHYLDGNLVIRIYIPDPGSLPSVISQFEFHNAYGNIELSDSMVSLMIGVDCLFFSLKEMLKVDSSSVNDNENHKVGEYIRFLSYKYENKYYLQTSNILYHYLSIALITNPFGYRIVESYPPTTREEDGNDREEFYYGPTDLLYEIDTFIITIIIVIIAIYTIMMIVTMVYLIKTKDRKIYKLIGCRYTAILLMVNIIINFIPIVFIIRPVSKMICNVRYFMLGYCLAMLLSLLYNRGLVVAKVTKNKTYFRVRYTNLQQLFNIFLPVIVFSIITITFRCVSGFEIARKLDHSSLFYNVYVEYCKGDKYEYGITVSLLYLYILYGFKLGWDIRYAGSGYLCSTIISVNSVMIIAGVILIPTFSLLGGMDKEKSLLWVWICLVFSAAVWLCIFGRI